MGENQLPLAVAQLPLAAESLRSAGSALKTDQLLRICLYYRLYFRDETLEATESLGVDSVGDSLAAEVFEETAERSEKPNESSEEAFGDAVSIYLRCRAEIDPKGTARLRRAIRAGCLDSNPELLILEDGNTWLLWIISFEIPQREDFKRFDSATDQPNNELGEPTTRIADSLADLAAAVRESSSQWSEHAGPKRGSFTPVVSGLGLPSLGQMIGLCAIGTATVCAMLFVFRLIGLI